MGIAKSREAMADADVVLLVVDATVGMRDGRFSADCWVGGAGRFHSFE